MYLVQTVQTSSPWRPQLPLPKDITVHVQDMDKSSKKDSKKWSLGNLFRRKKKELESDSSSDEDRKAGFIPQKRTNTLTNVTNQKKKKRASKLVGAFDHIVISPNQNHNTIDRFKETDSINSTDKYFLSVGGAGSLDRRLKKERVKGSRNENQAGSSTEDGSHRSSSISRFRSDDSLGNHSGSSNRKTRTARTERYLKRLSKDEGNSPVSVSRWHTQPVSPTAIHGSINSIDNSYRRGYAAPQSILRNSASLTNVPHNQIHPANHPQQPYRHPNPNPTATYENNFYIQSKASSMREHLRSPPPIPPRDPQRRLNMTSQEARPISYAFDKQAIGPNNSVWQMNGRCISDDRLWGPNQTVSPPRPASVQSESQPKRYISRHPQNITTTPQPPHHSHPQLPSTTSREYKYITDVTPRSRRPIHIIQDHSFEQTQPKQSSFVTAQRPLKSEDNSTTPTPSQKSPPQNASAFWRRIDDGQNRRGRTVERKPQPTTTAANNAASRSVSSSRALEIMNKRNLELTKELDHLLGDDIGKDEVDNVVSGRLYLRQSVPKNQNDLNDKFFEVKVRNRTSPTKNKYEEYVAKNISQIAAPQTQVVYKKYNSKPNNGDSKIPPQPPTRSVSKRSSLSEEELAKKRKSANLEEAINELEAIYKSLKLSDEDLLDRAERLDVSTPSSFKRSTPKPDYDDDDEDNSCEPDVVLDDLSYRSMKHANSSMKTPETQPPFGIPIGPIPPSPGTDYLNVQPPKLNKPRFIPQRSPDLVADDLAYRNLRKDKDLQQSILDRVRRSVSSSSEDSSQKRRATRSLSANIFSLIQRDAAKPSGGNLDDYFDVEYIKNIIKKDDDDMPPPVYVVPEKKERKLSSSPKNYYEANKGGAVFNLPSTLKSTSPSKTPEAPIAKPRKSISPAVIDSKHKSEFEDILNAIALEAKSTSEKLGQDLAELRKETKSVSSSTSPETSKSATNPIARKEKLENEIDEVGDKAKFCENILKKAVNPSTVKEQKLNKTELMKDIDDTSDAVMLCHAMIDRVVSPKDCAPEKSILSSLIKELTPSESQSFETLSKRCLEQLEKLDSPKYDEPDYDNLKKSTEEEIDIIMKACEVVESNVQIKVNDDVLLQVPHDHNNKDDSSLEFNVSSSPSFIKSSSETDNNFPKSSDLATYSLVSSSDCLKSQSSHSSSENRLPSDSLKSTSSTASSTVAGTADTITETSQSTNLIQLKGMTPSPPLNLTPSGDESQYNSAEELAMIFGIKSPTPSGNSEDLMCATEHGTINTNNNVDKSVWDSYRTNFNNNLDTIIEDLHEFDVNDSNDSNNNNNNNNNKNMLTLNPEIESNTTDSGNVSLNDFCSDFDRKFTFINEIQIKTNSKDDDYQFKNEINIIQCKLEENCDKNEVPDPELEPLVLEEVSTTNETQSKSEMRERKRRLDDDIDARDSREAGSSSSTSHSHVDKHASSDSILRPQHVLLACTYGLASNHSFDYITVIAIIIAIVTILALIML